MNLYAMGGVVTPDYVETTVDQQLIFSYWNSGLVAVRREMRLFSRWHDIFVEVMERGLVAHVWGGSSYVLAAQGSDFCHPRKKRLWIPQSRSSEDGHLLPLRRAGPLPRAGCERRLIFSASGP
jgi:hypothetical protein